MEGPTYAKSVRRYLGAPERDGRRLTCFNRIGMVDTISMWVLLLAGKPAGKAVSTQKHRATASPGMGVPAMRLNASHIPTSHRGANK